MGQKLRDPTPFLCTARVLYAMTSDMVTRKMLLNFGHLPVLSVTATTGIHSFFVGWMYNIHVNRRTSKDTCKECAVK
jgi:nitrate reductase NapE component